MSTGFGCSSLLILPTVMLIDSSGWRNTLVILGMGMWALGIPLSFVIRDNPEPYGYLPDGVKNCTTDNNRSAQMEKVDLPFMKAFKNRSFLLINLTESIRFLVLSSVILHIMPYLSTVGTTRFMGALATTGLPLFSIPGRFIFGGLGDRYDKRYVMCLAYLFMVTGMLFLNYANNIFSLVLFILFFPPGYGGLAVLRGSILREYYGRDLFPRMIGIMLGVSSIGGIIGPTITGRVYDTFGSYNYLWLIYAGILLLSILLISRVKPEKRDSL
jgi:sugar phosphate permease